MKLNEIELVDNILKPEDFVRLRNATAFADIPIEHARKALQNGLLNVSALKNGKVMLAYSRFDPETNKHWSRRMTLDPDSLKVLKEEDNNPHFWPSWIDEVKSTFSPKMESHVAADMAGGREWILRWESMPNNRDMPFEGPPFPPASELRVIKVR